VSETTQGTGRVAYIAGLRALADLLEQVPEVPIYRHGSISFALGGMSEADAFAVLDQAAEALTAAGVPFVRDDNDHHRRIELELAGLSYGFCRVYDTAVSAYQARESYTPVVQLDQVEEVAS
jgi:hypothetical protein